jgi:hypothetical protein
LTGRAAANTSATLNIDVSFNNAKSVEVDSSASSTDTAVWTVPNQALTSASSATVTNDSIVAEHWELYTNAASLTTGGATWSLASSTSSVGVDQFAVQAVFGSSNTANCSGITAPGTWNRTLNAPPLQATIGNALSYTSAGQLASPELTNNGQSTPSSGDIIHGGDTRALCWRLIAPQSTTATQSQTVQVIIAVY